MAIITTAGITRPNQQNQAGAIDALTIEEFTGVVEVAIRRKSVLAPFIKPRPVKGTNTLTNYAIGQTVLGVLKPGEAPDGTPADFSKASVTVDTVIIARNIVPILEDFQNNFGARSKLGTEQGEEIGKFQDQAYMIQGVKAARLTQSAYSGGSAGKPAGFKGGNRVIMGAANDELDPAKLYKAFSDLLIQMELKDVQPQSTDMILIVGPQQFYALQQAEQIVNGEYLTSDGNKLSGVPMFSAWGIPVVSSNNLPKTVITGHKLSTTGNSNAYDGDFTHVVALVISPRALLAGETIPLTSDVFFDKLSKQWFIDSWLAFGVTPDRAEYAGVLESFGAT